jgi:hypothetical protein
MFWRIKQEIGLDLRFRKEKNFPIMRHCHQGDRALSISFLEVSPGAVWKRQCTRQDVKITAFLLLHYRFERAFLQGIKM